MNKDLLKRIVNEDKPKIASANVYDNLYREIIELKLKPGSIISIKDMCEHFETGRSPMRDALIKLEQEGLITTLPQRGIMISKIDLSRVEEERFMRVCVEERVMDQFIKKHTSEDIAQLEKYLAMQMEANKEKDYRQFIVMDDKYHTVFYEATNKHYCAKTIQQVSGHYKRFRLLSVIDAIIVEDVIEQHRQIIEAIKENDAEKMRKVMKIHFSKILEEEIAMCKKYPYLFTEGDQPENEPKVWSEDFLEILCK